MINLVAVFQKCSCPNPLLSLIHPVFDRPEWKKCKGYIWRICPLGPGGCDHRPRGGSAWEQGEHKEESFNLRGAEFTLYITPILFYKSIGRSRYAGKGESVVHLMCANMVCRVDPLPGALSMQLVRYRKPPHEGRVCMCKVDSDRACTDDVAR